MNQDTGYVWDNFIQDSGNDEQYHLPAGQQIFVPIDMLIEYVEDRIEMDDGSLVEAEPLNINGL